MTTEPAIPYRALAALARRVAASPSWPGIPVRVQMLPDHAKERGRATAGTILLPRFGPRWVVAHELAHVLTWTERDDHGPAWRDAYRRMLTATAEA